jgi:hypothetical protein
MKRHQIRQMLGRDRCTDAQLRKAIADLNLPIEDDLDYGDAETKRIIQKIKGSQPDTQSDRAPQSPSQLSQTQQQAQEAAENLKVALVGNHQQRLVNLSTALDKAETRRGEVLDRLSDRMAYLQDENLFMNDLLRLTQKKLKGAQQQEPEKQEVTVTALDALVEAFDAVGDWEMPAIAPHSALGCLPM